MVSTLFFIGWVFSFLATIAKSNLQHRTKGIERRISQFWIRISGFELHGGNHYTIEPTLVQDTLTLCEVPSLVGFCSLFVKINVCLLIGFFLFFVESFLLEPIFSTVIYNMKQKILKKQFYHNLKSGLKIQSPRC